MQQWEYLWVRCDQVAIGQWRPRWVNQEELHNWKEQPDLPTYTNWLGDKGWELVSTMMTPALPSHGGMDFRLVFKRPR